MLTYRKTKRANSYFGAKPKFMLAFHNLFRVLHQKLVYMAMARFDQARIVFENAIFMVKEFYGENHPAIARHFGNLGLVLMRLQQPEKAKDYFEKAVKIYENQTSDSVHPSLATAIGNLGLAYQALSENDKALSCFDRALELHTTIFGTVVHPSVAGALHNKGTLLCSQDDYQNGIQILLKALQIDIQVHGENHPEVSYDCRTIASVYLSSNDPDKAQRYTQRAMAIDKAIKIQNGFAEGENYLHLGMASTMKKQYTRAIRELSHSVQVLEKYYQGEKGELLELAKLNLQLARIRS